MNESGRSARLVVVDDDRVLGALPPLSLELPWWPEAHDVVAAVRARDGIDVTVLRLLATDPDRTSGGAVCYLVETDRPPAVPLDPWPGDPLIDHPLRQSWARPGGPAELLSWAERTLSAEGRRPAGRPEQMRTWNLSTLWRLPADGGRVWLKAVPDFFAHEGAVIDWIGPPVAPRLIDFAPGRALIEDIAGAANHDLVDPVALRPMVRLLTELQRRSLDRLDELAVLGVPDRRLSSMIGPIADVVEDWGSGLETSERRSLDVLVDGLPALVSMVEACGVPDTLVHGDFHPGNVAGPPGAYVILDWGDSFLGHPLIDELAFAERLPTATKAAVRSWFIEDWRQIVPGSDPARAVDLLEPVVALLAAAMYARFCAAIEPDERVYHQSDVIRMLRLAAAGVDR